MSSNHQPLNDHRTTARSAHTRAPGPTSGQGPDTKPGQKRRSETEAEWTVVSRKKKRRGEGKEERTDAAGGSAQTAARLGYPSTSGNSKSSSQRGSETLDRQVSRKPTKNSRNDSPPNTEDRELNTREHHHTQSRGDEYYSHITRAAPATLPAGVRPRRHHTERGCALLAQQWPPPLPQAQQGRYQQRQPILTTLNRPATQLLHRPVNLTTGGSTGARSGCTCASTGGSTGIRGGYTCAPTSGYTPS